MKYVAEEADFLKLRKNNILLSDNDIEILNKCSINYLDFKNIDELLFCITERLMEIDSFELEELSNKLSEIKYYNYTNK